MQILLVLVICLALFPDNPQGGVADPWECVAWAVVGITLVGIAAELLSWYYARRLYQQPSDRQKIVRQYSRWRVAHLGLTIGVYLLTLFKFTLFGWGWGLGWGAMVRSNWGLAQTILLDELFILAPFLAALVIGWYSFHRVEQALHDISTTHAATPFWSRGAYVLFHLRHYLGLVLAPILIFTGVHEILTWLFPGLQGQDWFQLASLGFLIVMVVVLMPWLLTVIWDARSFPHGPLRDRLEAAARRMRFRYTDIKLWNTRGGVANAMVTGIFPIPRYVLLSDGLIQNLPPDEVEAVFGHEIGHVKHQHMPLYLAFVLLSIVLLTLAFQMLLHEQPDEVNVLSLLGSLPAHSGTLSRFTATLAFLGGYIWLVFGFLSRRCERQADIYGCKTVSCSRGTCLDHTNEILVTPATTLCPTGIRTFITALERVADLNGIRRDKPSWRHSSIARRVNFLEQVMKDPATERRFQRRLCLLKCVLLGSLVTVVGVFLREQVLQGVQTFVTEAVKMWPF